MQFLFSYLPNIWLRRRTLLIILCLFVLLVFASIKRHSIQSAAVLPQSAPIVTDVLSAHNTTVWPHGLPTCVSFPNMSVGAIDVDTKSHSWESLQTKYLPSALLGLSANDTESSVVRTFQSGMGLWSPAHCRSLQTLAIIIPFRDREEHLRIFVNHMHNFLQHQQLTYTIFIVEQLGNTLFNRAALFNVGFIESRRLADYDCFIFHDVDLLPQDDRIPYRCELQPVHLSVAVDKFRYRLPYTELFGGAVAMSKRQFEKVRGFSNCYFGWGGEDDDMYTRVIHNNYKVKRHPTYVSRYLMLKHSQEKLNRPNPVRTKLLGNALRRMLHDGYPETRYVVKGSGLAYGGLFYRIPVLLDKNQTSPLYNQNCQ